MANQADGTIYVDTEIDAEGFRAGSAELQRAIKSLSTSVNNLGPLFQKALAGNEKAVQSFQSKAAALQETISQLEAKMQALGTKTVPTEQYSKISADIAKLETRFDSLMDKQDKMLALGVDQESQSWKSLQYDIETCGQKIRELTAEKERMEQSGKAFQLGSETAQYQKMAQQLEAARKKLSDMQARLSESNTESSHLAENARKAATHIGSAAKSASGKLVFGLRQAASTMWRMATHGRSANRQFDGLIAQAKRFALGLLGAEGIFTLLRKVTNDYMSQNQQLSATLSSCWSGIGNILGPIITRLVNLVAAAVSYVTQFLSLFGIYGKTATKAIDSAGGAASGAAKELKRELASFDELNILSDNNSGGGGGGGGLDLGNDPADVELPDWAKLMAEQMKNGKWSAAGATLAGAFNSWIDNFNWNSWGARLGKGIQNGFSFALGFIRNAHWEGLGGGFAGFLNNTIENIDPKDLGALLASKLRIMVDMAYGFVTTFQWGNFGDWLGDIVNGWFAEIDWVKAAKTFSTGIKGILTSALHFLQTADWKAIGAKLGSYLKNVEWGDIFSGLWDVIKEAGSALMDFLDGLHAGLGDLLPIVEAIAIAFAAWKIGSGIIGGLDKIMGFFGKKGGGESGIFSIPSPKTVLKGLFDLGLIITGMMGLIAIINEVSKTPGFDEAMSGGVAAIQKAFSGLGSVALQIAAASVGVAALGKLGVKRIAKGFADLAIILAGVPAVITAVGALMSIPGFEDFLGTGVSSIKTAFTGLSDVALQIAVASVGIALLGKVGISTVLQGFVSLAAILAGVPAVITAVGALMSIPGFQEFLSTGAASIQTAFEALGDVGLEIAGFSALIVGLGLATPATILSGLAGFALVVGGLEVVLVALGALGQIPGFSWIVGEGGKVLMQLGEILGGFAGSIVKGALTKISDSFPAVADNLSLFAKKLEPFLTVMQSVDGGIAEATGHLANAILQLTAANLLDSITSFLTGGKSLADFGDQLTAFGPKFKAYADSVKGIDPAVVTASASAAQSMAELAKNIPGQGGLWQMLAGEQDIGVFGAQLVLFGRYFKNYADQVKGIDPSVVTASASAAQSMVELAKDIPATGGLWQMIAGGQDIGAFGGQLYTFGRYFALYASSVKGVSGDVVTRSAAAAQSLIALAGEIPTSGGLWQFLTGQQDMGAFGESLAAFGAYFKQYYTNIQGIDTGYISTTTTLFGGLADLADRVKSIDTGKVKSFGDAIKHLGDKLSGTKWQTVGSDFSSGMSTMLSSLKNGVEGMKSSIDGLETDLTSIWGRIVTAAFTKWEEVRGKINQSNDAISRDTSQKWSGIKRNLDTCLSNIKTSLDNKLKLILTSVQTTWKSADSDTTTKWGNIQKTVTDKAAATEKAVSDSFQKAKTNASNRAAETATNVTNAWSGLSSRAYSWGVDIAISLASGMDNNRWRVTNAASNLAGSIKSYLHFSEPDKGPLSDFHTYMPDMVDLMAKGITDSQPRVLNAVSNMASAISEEINAGEYTIGAIAPTAKIDGALSSFSDKVSGSFTNLLDRLQAIAEKVTFRVPAAAYGMVPYQPAAVAGAGKADIAAIEASNDELGQVIVQVVMNAVGILVAAIEKQGGTTRNIDKATIAQITIDEINRRTRSTGRSPIET